jgi:hypothetical protein
MSICEETSKRATATCPTVVEKSFPAGTKVGTCRIHQAPRREASTEEKSATAPQALKDQGERTPEQDEPSEVPSPEPTPAPTPLPTPAPTPAPRRLSAREREEQRRAELRRQRQERAEVRPATPEPEAVPREIEIVICSETSKRANAHCPEKLTRRFPAGTKIRACTMHRPQPGEEDR